MALYLQSLAGVLVRPVLVFFAVPLVAVIWRALSTESTKPSLWHFAHFIPIAFFALLATAFVGVAGFVIGAIVGVIFSVPFAAFVGFGRRGFFCCAVYMYSYVAFIYKLN